ncbi:MAG: hypothetical protein KJZ80_09580 [Hyphomicrobiaceae bacterium]|nr:hypothetical protein [Hyphomicrobiaceae bacterium]
MSFRAIRGSRRPRDCGRAAVALLASVFIAGMTPPVAAQVVAYDPKCRPTAFADPTVDPRQRGRAHPAPSKPDPACAIRAHMFLVSQQLDWLKMNVDLPVAAERSAAMLQRMQKLLLTLQSTPPFTVARLPEAERPRRMAAYQGCLMRTAGLAAKAEAAVRKGDTAVARGHVERIDATSHDCHLKHAFPKYPGR